jgi:hypothetical protein
MNQQLSDLLVCSFVRSFIGSEVLLEPRPPSRHDELMIPVGAQYMAGSGRSLMIPTASAQLWRLETALATE